MNTNKKQQWNDLKHDLLVVQKEFQDRNGLEFCKNCGVDFRYLINKIEDIFIYEDR